MAENYSLTKQIFYPHVGVSCLVVWGIVRRSLFQACHVVGEPHAGFVLDNRLSRVELYVGVYVFVSENWTSDND